MFDNNLFSQRLKALRLLKNLTLEKLGLEFGVTKQAVGRWESQDRLPPLNIVYDIADYFDVSIDYLVGRSDDPKRY